MVVWIIYESNISMDRRIWLVQPRLTRYIKCIPSLQRDWLKKKKKKRKGTDRQGVFMISYIYSQFDLLFLGNCKFCMKLCFNQINYNNLCKTHVKWAWALKYQHLSFSLVLSSFLPSFRLSCKILVIFPVMFLMSSDPPNPWRYTEHLLCIRPFSGRWGQRDEQNSAPPLNGHSIQMSTYVILVFLFIIHI